MCTLSWRQSEDRLSLWFNRDEQRARATARPPRVHKTESAPSPRYLAPTDPQGGGTWIFVNALGLVACLTNHYDAKAAPPPRPVSRGRLLASLAGSRNPGDLARGLRNALDTSPHAPFHLWTATPAIPPRIWRWDGVSLEEIPIGPLPMHTTSSYRSAEVANARRHTFQRLIADPLAPLDRELEAFQRQHDPDTPAHSVRMEREDARTVSLVHVTVCPGTLRMTYEDEHTRSSKRMALVPCNEKIFA